MRTTVGRLVIGAVIGLVGLMLLDGSTTRLAAFAGWMVVWTLTVVLREGRLDRWRREDAAEAAALAEAAAAEAAAKAAAEAASPHDDGR